MNTLSTQQTSFRVLQADNSLDFEEWITLWQLWPQREVHAHPNYLKLYVDGRKSQALCASWTSPAGFVLFPFILRDLTIEPYWSPEIGNAVDIVTPYGYGGPYVWGTEDIQDISEEFWASFDTWGVKQNLVSEFIRFSLFHDTLLNYPGQQEVRLNNIIRDLDLDLDAIWMDFKSAVRKNVKKAERDNITIELDDGKRLDDFLYLYEHTMNRRGASTSYYFPRAYFEQIHQTLPGQFLYFHAVHDQKIISTELVLVSEHHVYSFLGGTDEDSFELRPNDLLKYEIIRWAKLQGKQRFILGGGYEGEDGIFKYKLKFSPKGILPFSVGYRIHREDLYEQLVRNKTALAKSSGIKLEQSCFFPLYRA
jgi:Acetyltransferase (GNAT) domain